MDIQICGDGTIQSPEECDDGNTVDTDECSNECKIQTTRIGSKICCSVLAVAKCVEKEECSGFGKFPLTPDMSLYAKCPAECLIGAGGVDDEQTNKNLVPAIRARDIERKTSKELLGYSCVVSEQCKEGDCQSVTYLKEKGFISDAKETEILSTSSIFLTSAGGVLGTGGCLAGAVALGIPTSGVSLLVGLPLCAIAGGSAGFGLDKWLGSMDDPSALGYCISSAPTGVAG
ncbi:unnamed protein product, partial [marine sediment metagenome]